MKRRILVLMVPLLALSGGLLEAQETARDRAREALPAEVFRGIEALAAEATDLGIPEEPLFNKALEGMAKRVPAERLLPAVTAYSGRLREAWAAFGTGATGALAVAGADALKRGVEVETLQRLGQGGPPREGGRPGGPPGEGGGAVGPPGEGEDASPSAVAVLVLADLVESGVPADRALGVLREAMQMRTREQQMLGISGRVRQLIRQGRSPQDAAEQVRRALQRGRGTGGVGPPVPPGSEPVTARRTRSGGTTP